MRALKARRRFYRWARYQHRCWRLAQRPAAAGRPTLGQLDHKTLHGYAMSSWDWSTACRYPPIGIREVRDPVTGVRY